MVGYFKAEIVQCCGVSDAPCYIQRACIVCTLKLGAVSGVEGSLHVALG